MIEYYRFFSQKAFAEQFVRGEIYLNALGYFWKNGFEGQGDFGEAAARSFSPRQLRLPDELCAHVKGDVVDRPLAYRYCNVGCFTRLIVNDGGGYVVRPTALMQHFGDYAVRIKDFPEFSRRVASAAKKNRDVACGAPVRYTDKVAQPLCNCFVKSQKYDWQFEWRLAYLHDLPALKRDARNERKTESLFDWKPFTLFTGDLSDICQLYPSVYLWNDDVKRIYPSLSAISMDKFARCVRLTDAEQAEFVREISYSFCVNAADEGEFHRTVLSVSPEKSVLFQI